MKMRIVLIIIFALAIFISGCALHAEVDGTAFNGSVEKDHKVSLTAGQRAARD